MVLEKQRTMLHGNPVYSSESYDNYPMEREFALLLAGTHEEL